MRRLLLRLPPLSANPLPLAQAVQLPGNAMLLLAAGLVLALWRLRHWPDELRKDRT